MIGKGVWWPWWVVLAGLVFISSECNNELDTKTFADTEVKIIAQRVRTEQRSKDISEESFNYMQILLADAYEALKYEHARRSPQEGMFQLDTTKNPDPVLLKENTWPLSDQRDYFAYGIVNVNMTWDAEKMKEGSEKIMKKVETTEVLKDQNVWQVTGEYRVEGSNVPLRVGLYITERAPLEEIGSNNRGPCSVTFTKTTPAERKKREQYVESSGLKEYYKVETLGRIVDIIVEQAISSVENDAKLMVKEEEDVQRWDASWSASSIGLPPSVTVTITYVNTARAVVFRPLSSYVSNIIQQPKFKEDRQHAVNMAQFELFCGVHVTYAPRDKTVMVKMDIEYSIE